MGTLSSYRMEAEQRGTPNSPLTNFFIQLTVNNLWFFAMLIAGSMKRGGHDVSLENVNENHEQNLLKVPELIEHYSLLNKMPDSQPELVSGVLLLLETLGFFPCPADCFGCWYLAMGWDCPHRKHWCLKEHPGQCIPL